jgi:hypothetical protein
MKYIRLTAFTATLLLTLGACSKSDEPPLATDDVVSNDLLAYVPSGTPYLLANLEPVPEEVIDAFLNRLQPVLDSMQSQLSIAMADMEAAGGGVEGTGGTEDIIPEHDPGARLVHALLQELDGKLSRLGLESLGFDLRSEKALYGMGVFPVIRLGLSDPAALRETIERVLENAGMDAPEQVFRGVRFWRLSDDNTADATAGLYFSILEDHLAIGVFPPMAEEELLPAFLGLELPADSDAAARLSDLNRKHGYTPHGSGVLDLHKLADRFMTPGTVIARLMAYSGNFDAESLTPECVSEIHGIIDNAPRMTVGTVELTPSAVAYQYRVETPDSLAKQLMGMVSKIPGIEAHSERILEFAFGMRFGPVRDFLLEKTTNITENPYQCEHLQELNDSATETLVQLNQPMPPFVNNFLGVRLSLNEIMMNRQPIPENARGHLAVHVEQPEMFIGMAQMFLPDLSELAIIAGDPPVRLPESLTPVPGAVAYAAMSTDAIGLALGEGEEAGLVNFLEREAGPEDTFLSVSYDMAAYLDYTGGLGQYNQQAGGETTDEENPSAQTANVIAEAARNAFREMADRGHTTLRFTPDGFVADNRMTFK